MKKGSSSSTLAVIAGALVGLIFGCLITWYPIRLSFCAVYHTPDCEQIVLMVFPFYCLIAPLLGGVIAYYMIRRKGAAQAGPGAVEDGAAGEDQGQAPR